MTSKHKRTGMSGVLEIPDKPKKDNDTPKDKQALNPRDTSINTVIPEYTDDVIERPAGTPFALANTRIEIKAELTAGRQEAKEKRRDTKPTPQARRPTAMYYDRHLSRNKREESTPSRLERVNTRMSILTPVMLETPYSGNVELHMYYAKRCLLDCIKRGEAPFASHLLYTQPGILRDEVSTERELGIKAGFAWRELAAYTVVYTDLGISLGMRQGVDDARHKNLNVFFRELGVDHHTLQRELVQMRTQTQTQTQTGLTKQKGLTKTQKGTRTQKGLTEPRQNGVSEGVTVVVPLRRKSCLSYLRALMALAHRLLRWVWPVRSAKKPKNESSSPKNPPKDP